MVGAWRFGTVGLVSVLLASAVLIPAFQLAHPKRPEGALGGSAVALLAITFLGATGASLGWLRLLPGNALGFITTHYFGNRLSHTSEI